MRDYTELPALQYFVLEESWVLGITARPGSLEIEIDLTFARDHPELRPPRQGDQIYGRVGLIRFTSVSSLDWSGQGNPPAIDASGERDWGAIDSFTWDAATYELTGDFGRIRVDAASVESLLTGPV
jgi:hypothetical protein